MEKRLLHIIFVILCGILKFSEGLECGFPGVPLNGSVSGSGMMYYPGETVTYNCQTGFVLFGPNTRNCTENGTWSLTVPECRENLALGKPALQSSTLWSYDPKLAVDSDPNSCSFTLRSSEQRWWQVQLGVSIVVQSVVITITPGSFQKFTIFIIELLEGNKAMYKPCSKFVGKFDAKKAVFLCNDGLGHPGQFVYIRDEREEQEYFGLCEVEVFQLKNETQCGDPEQPISSVVHRVSNSLVEYSCLKGYRLEGGNKTRTCTKTGFWSGQTPRCVEVQCSDPLSVKDGFIEVSNFKGKYVFGSLATYHCNPGFILWGNASRLCAEYGDWTGVRPQCKPITCGMPQEVPNSKYDLLNGTTSWKSFATYTCKPGFKMVYQNKNLSEISTFCTESGLWQPLAFSCIFDPLAVNLKQGSKIFGELSVLGEDGLIHFGTLATIGVLSTLILLVCVVVVMFFNQRRKSDGSERKISRSSTNQLIADVANGLASHFEGPNPPMPEDKNPDTATTFLGGVDVGSIPYSSSSESSNVHNNLIQMNCSPTRFAENQGSIVEIKDWNLLEHNTPIAHAGSRHHVNGSLTCPRKVSGKSNKNIDYGKRSAGDGDSSIEDSSLHFSSKGNPRQIILDEETQYLLARRPDGKTDDNIYSTLRETKNRCTNLGVLYNNPNSSVEFPDDRVYESLRENDSNSPGSFINVPQQNVLVRNSVAVNQELMSLYAQVDKSRIVKPNRASGGSSCSSGASLCSPSEDQKGQKSMRKKLPDKFGSNSSESSSTMTTKVQNNHHHQQTGNVYANISNKISIGEKSINNDSLRLTENPSASHCDVSPPEVTTPRHRMFRPTTLHYNTYKPTSNRPMFQRDENNYATIGGNSKRLVTHLRSANV